MEKITIGSGLTECSRVTYTYEEWTKLDPLAPHRTCATYPEWLMALRDRATQVLTRAGRPTEDMLIHVVNDGQWRYVADETSFQYDGPATLIRGLDFSDHEERRSIEWYASKILRLVNAELALLRPRTKAQIRSHSETRARSRQQRRMREVTLRANASRLAMLIVEANFKLRHEKAALLGHAQFEAQTAWQAAGAQARKTKGEETTGAIKRHFDDVLEHHFNDREPTRIQLQRLTPSKVVRLMRVRAGVKATAAFSESTLRRHIVKLLQARMAAIEE